MKTRDKFSPYSLRLYDVECAKQYYFEYLDAYTSDFRNKPKLKQILVEDGRSKDLVFGDVVHRTLNDFFHLAPKERTESRLTEILKETWTGPRGKERGFPEIEDERKHYERALKLLKRFAQTQNLNPEIAYLPQTENEGEFVKENLLMFPFEPGTILQGKIDRIDREEDGYHLIDYKTSRSETHDDLQLSAYAILSRQALGKPIHKASYLYLESGNFKTFPVTEETEAKTRQRILELISRIKADEEFSPRPGKRCYWCPYVEFCPAKDKANEYISELRQSRGETETTDLPF
jgi:CRISPR/Cas system-associated exonuclease Cas4 (RecB family)